MDSNDTNEDQQARLRFLTRNLERGTLVKVRKMLNALHPADIAQLLESLPHKQRFLLWELVDSSLEGDVLTYVNADVRERLIEKMDKNQLIAAMEGMEIDDLADIISDLPEAVIKEVLQSMDSQNRRRLESLLSYPEDTAGGLMNPAMVSVRPDVTIEVVLRYLRFLGELPEFTDGLMVVNRNDKYLGVLPLTTLLTHDSDLTVAEVFNARVAALHVGLSAAEVTKLFENHDLVSAPVVDDQGKLLGRITIDDVVDVIRNEAEHSIKSLAGVAQDDLFGPVGRSLRRRSTWLGINLLTALLASFVIALFEATIQKIVALAVLMPIVASMGGIAGSQTLTLVIRGIALGDIGGGNARWLLLKELAVGALNGLIFATVMGIIAFIWFQDYLLSVLIGIALIANLVCAAIAGALLPLGLRRLGIDPALAGSVILTTITDVVGFLVFLGLATLLVEKLHIPATTSLWTHTWIA